MQMSSMRANGAHSRSSDELGSHRACRQPSVSRTASLNASKLGILTYQYEGCASIGSLLLRLRQLAITNALDSGIHHHQSPASAGRKRSHSGTLPAVGPHQGHRPAPSALLQPPSPAQRPSSRTAASRPASRLRMRRRLFVAAPAERWPRAAHCLKELTVSLALQCWLEAQQAKLSSRLWSQGHCWTIRADV